MTRDLSRREFATLAAGAIATPFVTRRSRALPLTAQDVIDRIKKNVGVDWDPASVDTFKTGDPAAAVTGVVVTNMATLAVLERAVKAGANVIVTCEPTFFGRADRPTPAADPIVAGKRAFIDTHQLVIWRFSDHWRKRTPDPLAAGLADALGWAKSRTADNPSRVAIPSTTLRALAAHVKKTLGARGGIRVIGDPQLRVQRVGLLPGTTAIQAALKLLPDVDVIIAGEIREWETAEYARDKVTAGEKKALMTLGRVLSEGPGMKACADWLRPLLTEVKTTWIPVGDPYWRPA